MKIVVVVAAACLAFHVAPASGQPADSLQVPADLTLTDALRLALVANPGQRALGLEIQKSQGRTRQASARPNPGLALELENVGGTLPAFGVSEATLSIGQILELGGKRSARMNAARAEEGVISLDVAAGRLGLVSVVATRFIEALASDRALDLSNEEVHAAEEAAASTSQRVRAGAAHPVERQRAEVELANVRLERTSLEAEAALARSRLSLLWGDPEPRFQRLRGALDSLPEPPALDSLAARAEGSPALARWQAESEARRRRLALERVRGRQDLGVAFGLRSFAEGDERTFVGALSMPLPLFDRNRGSIDEAAAALEQVRSEGAEARLEARRALAEGHTALRRSRNKLQSLRRDVLPVAATAFEEMRVGFERGRFTYLDLLEARRTWIRARREELHTLIVGHLAITDLERLLGGPLETSNREGETGR